MEESISDCLHGMKTIFFPIGHFAAIKAASPSGQPFIPLEQGQGGGGSLGSEFGVGGGVFNQEGSPGEERGWKVEQARRTDHPRYANERHNAAGPDFPK